MEAQAVHKFGNFLVPFLFSSPEDIDQLTRIMGLVGTPDERLLAKLLTDEVSSLVYRVPVHTRAFVGDETITHTHA